MISRLRRSCAGESGALSLLFLPTFFFSVLGEGVRPEAELGSPSFCDLPSILLGVSFFHVTGLLLFFMCRSRFFSLVSILVRLELWFLSGGTLTPLPHSDCPPGFVGWITSLFFFDAYGLKRSSSLRQQFNPFSSELRPKFFFFAAVVSFFRELVVFFSCNLFPLLLRREALRGGLFSYCLVEQLPHAAFNDSLLTPSPF